jgi:hypothetical protein
MIASCAGCDRTIGENDSRYLSQQRGTGIFALCEACGEKIARLTLQDPQGAELDALTDKILFTAALPQGTA